MADLELIRRLVQVGDFDTAVESLEKIVLEEPQNLEAWRMLADAYQDEKEKVRCLRQILILSPQDEAATQRLEEMEAEQAHPYEAALGGLRGGSQEDGDYLAVNEPPKKAKANAIARGKDLVAGFLEDDKKFIALVAALVVLIIVTVIGML